MSILTKFKTSVETYELELCTSINTSKHLKRPTSYLTTQRLSGYDQHRRSFLVSRPQNSYVCSFSMSIDIKRNVNVMHSCERGGAT